MSNDFNFIFKLLPSFYQKLEESYGRGSRSCFIAAMPGSFYGRLFPDNSMHFIHSSYSLHWLSQVRQSPALLLLTRIAMLVFMDPHYLNFHYYLSKPLTAWYNFYIITICNSFCNSFAVFFFCSIKHLCPYTCLYLTFRVLVMLLEY